MLMALGKLVTGVLGLGSTFLEGRQKIKEAKIEREVKALTTEEDWNKVQAENSANSWKDEWLTLLVSIPLIMAFIPDMVEYVDAGFAVLGRMPEWYQILVSLVFAASFGYRALVNKFGMGKNKGTGE